MNAGMIDDLTGELESKTGGTTSIFEDLAIQELVVLLVVARRLARSKPDQATFKELYLFHETVAKEQGQAPVPRRTFRTILKTLVRPGLLAVTAENRWNRTWTYYRLDKNLPVPVIRRIASLLQQRLDTVNRALDFLEKNGPATYPELLQGTGIHSPEGWRVFRELQEHVEREITARGDRKAVCWRLKPAARQSFASKSLAVTAGLLMNDCSALLQKQEGEKEAMIQAGPVAGESEFTDSCERLLLPARDRLKAGGETITKASLLKEAGLGRGLLLERERLELDRLVTDLTRQARVERHGQRLLEARARLLEQGVGSMTVEGLLKEAGMSFSTVHLHVELQELLFELRLKQDVRRRSLGRDNQLTWQHVLDEMIVSFLQSNGPATRTRISARLSVNPASVHERLVTLERRGLAGNAAFRSQRGKQFAFWYLEPGDSNGKRMLADQLEKLGKKIDSAQGSCSPGTITTPESIERYRNRLRQASKALAAEQADLTVKSLCKKARIRKDVVHGNGELHAYALALVARVKINGYKRRLRQARGRLREQEVRLTVTALLKEAGISASTLYRFKALRDFARKLGA